MFHVHPLCRRYSMHHPILFTTLSYFIMPGNQVIFGLTAEYPVEEMTQELWLRR